jgi:hypothetical protein
MAKPYSILQNKMSPEARAESRRRADELIAAMPLWEQLRKTNVLAQTKVQKFVDSKQGQISQADQTDMYTQNN